MIAQFAELYVNLIEPGAQILAIIIVIAFLLHGFNLLRGGKASEGLVGGFVSGLIKLCMKTVQLMGRGLLSFLGFSIRTFKLLLATVRDFFRSQDL